MKTLQTIFNKLKPGDIVLKQLVTRELKFRKPQLVIIVGIDIWDMACVVHYTDYKDFEFIQELQNSDGAVVVESFGEWMEAWYILGHWKTMPKFTNLLKSYRRLRR